eukprot:364867-Chlamydomonas_euryale.AAC.9
MSPPANSTSAHVGPMSRPPACLPASQPDGLWRPSGPGCRCPRRCAAPPRPWTPPREGAAAATCQT